MKSTSIDELKDLAPLITITFCGSLATANRLGAIEGESGSGTISRVYCIPLGPV